MGPARIFLFFLCFGSFVRSFGGFSNQQVHGCSLTTGSRCTTLPSPAPTPEVPKTCSATLTHTYRDFSYTVETSVRYATAVLSPLSQITKYAPPFASVSGLLPKNVKYTTYSLNRDETTLQDGQFGRGAYARLWATLSYNTTVPFTTTMKPTAVVTSELVYPPALYTACPQRSVGCLECYKLPKDFIWGVAGSAFQIEGGLTSDGRGPSQLDTIGALPNNDGSANAEVADMNYWLYKQDIARLAAMGIPYYSFSISWTRIVPFGTVGSPINEPGLAHYDDLINTCIEYGITPIATLNHDDAPLNVTYTDSRFADSFLYYAKQVMTRYGDRIPFWVTLNEPNINYGTSFRAVRNILMGHAKVYHWYKGVLKGTGKITLKFANNLAVPLNGSNSEDTRAAFRYQDFILGVLANPIFLGKQYPSEVLKTEGVNLTALTVDELSYINGTADFFAFDPYTAGFATSPPNGIDACASNMHDELWPNCVVNTNVQQDGWLNGQASYAYAYIAPQYVRQQLGYVWNVFRPKGVLIAEFGFNPFMEYAEPVVAQRYDLQRSLYYQWFLEETLKSIYEDGVNVIGALAWSFVDNDEFFSYEQQYGLQHVNRTDGKFTRTYKRSFFDFVDFFHTYISD